MRKTAVVGLCTHMHPVHTQAHMALETWLTTEEHLLLRGCRCEPLCPAVLVETDSIDCRGDGRTAGPPWPARSSQPAVLGFRTQFPGLNRQYPGPWGCPDTASPACLDQAEKAGIPLTSCPQPSSTQLPCVTPGSVLEWPLCVSHPSPVHHAL